MTVVPAARLPHFDTLARAVSGMASDLAAFPDQPALIASLDRPLKMIDRRIEPVIGASGAVDAALAASRIDIAAVRAELAGGTVHPAALSDRLARIGSALERAEEAAQHLGDDVRDVLVSGRDDVALSEAAWRALDELPEYSRIVQRSSTPLQGPLMRAFDIARKRGAGEHVVVGASNIPHETGMAFAPNHSGFYDMTLLGALRVGGDVRPMKVAGYTPVRRLLVDPLLERAGAYTVQAGAKPVPGAPDVTRGDMGIAVSSRLLRDGHNIVVFPQGNIDPFDTVTPIYDGVARAALESGRPIVPVANWGTNPAARWSGAPRGAVTVIGEPIDVAGVRGSVSRHNVGVVSDQLHLRMLDLVDEARAVHREQFGRS